MSNVVFLDLPFVPHRSDVPEERDDLAWVCPLAFLASALILIALIYGTVRLIFG